MAESKPQYSLENAEQLFEEFIKENNRQYKDAEDKEIHFKVFVKNLEKINKLNKEHPTATFAINKFADYTEEESKKMFGAKQ